jgi:signal transduction histidine kinase
MALLLGISSMLLGGFRAAPFPLVPAPFVSAAAILFLLVGIASIAAAGASLRRMIMPLDKLLEASDKVADGDFSARMPEAGPPELRSVARAFNSMASRLESHDAQRRAMLADVTHELRTPLTVVKGTLEGLIDGMYPADESRLKSMLEEVDLLTRLTDDMRMLAAAETTGLELRKEQTDLAVLLDEAVSGFRAYAQTAGVRIELDMQAPSAVMNVDGERIRQVITNLLSNALRHSAVGGLIRIGIAKVQEAEVPGIQVWVMDTGPGIAPEDIPHVFDRYHKSADSRGMGIGLSIAKFIVEAHDGTIEATSSPGHGTTVRFSLPG